MVIKTETICLYYSRIMRKKFSEKVVNLLCITKGIFKFYFNRIKFYLQHLRKLNTNKILIKQRENDKKIQSCPIQIY